MTPPAERTSHPDWATERRARIATHPLSVDLHLLASQQQWLMDARLPVPEHIALIELCVQVSLATRDGLPCASTICTRNDWQQLAAAKRRLLRVREPHAEGLVALIDAVQDHAIDALGHHPHTVLGVPARPQTAGSVRAQLFGAR